MLTNEWIKVVIGNCDVYNRGSYYYDASCVKKMQLLEDHRIIQARVGGERLHNVLLKVDINHKITECSCDCLECSSFTGACDHIVAALIAFKNEWTKCFPEDKTEGVVFTQLSRNLAEQQPYPIEKMPPFL